MYSASVSILHVITVVLLSLEPPRLSLSLTVHLFFMLSFCKVENLFRAGILLLRSSPILDGRLQKRDEEVSQPKLECMADLKRLQRRAPKFLLKHGGGHRLVLKQNRGSRSSNVKQSRFLSKHHFMEQIQAWMVLFDWCKGIFPVQIENLKLPC